MGIRYAVAICLILGNAVLGQVALGQPATAPSISDIEADFAAKRYQEVLRKSAAALQVRQGLVGPDRVAVLELKAESHLQLKQYAPAADTYLAALKEVAADSLAGAKYQATARLLKSLTTGGQYQPKSAASASSGERASRPAAISVVEPADRELALLAFFNDERRTVESGIDRLNQQRTLPLVQSAIAKLDELRILELAATGTDATTKLMRDPLKSHVAAILHPPVVQIEEKIKYMERLASKDRTISQTVTPSGVRQEISQKVGLTAAEQVEMQGVVRDLNTIITTAKDLGGRLGVTVEGSGESGGSTRGKRPSEPTLESVYADANEQLKLAKDVLGANYVSTPVNPTRGRSTRPTPGGP